MWFIVSLLNNATEEFSSEIVIANAAGAECEPTVQVALLCGFQGNFWVLDDLVVTIHFANDADSLSGKSFLHDLNRN